MFLYVLNYNIWMKFHYHLNESKMFLLFVVGTRGENKK